MHARGETGFGAAWALSIYADSRTAAGDAECREQECMQDELLHPLLSAPSPPLLAKSTNFKRTEYRSSPSQSQD